MKKLIVRREAVLHNIAEIQKRTQGTLWGVVKYDGYGMGLLFMAGVLREAGIHHLAVSEIEDILRLRQEGFLQETILCMRSTGIPQEAEEVVRLGAVATVGSLESAQVLQGAAQAAQRVVDAHIKVDTGLGRYGFLPSQLAEIASVYRDFSHIRVTGIYTHFSSACCSRGATLRQVEGFRQVLEGLRRQGVDPGMTHASNSAALFRWGDWGMDAVRVGSALIGRVPGGQETNLQHVEEMACAITEVKWLPKGFAVGYGGQYALPRAMRVAVVPIGSWDGYARQTAAWGLGPWKLLENWLRDGLHRMKSAAPTVLVEGIRVPVLGRVGHGHILVAAPSESIRPGSCVTVPVEPLQLNTATQRVYI